MRMLDVLEQNPNAASLIRQHYTSLLKDKIDADVDYSEEFKNFINDFELVNEKVVDLISSAPRSLFDFFDSQKIYVSTPIEWENGVPKFRCDIDGSVAEQSFSTRKEAEIYLIENAIHILEGRLISN